MEPGRYYTIVVLMLGQRLQRWPNIKTTMVLRLQPLRPNLPNGWWVMLSDNAHRCDRVLSNTNPMSARRSHSFSQCFIFAHRATIRGER